MVWNGLPSSSHVNFFETIELFQTIIISHNFLFTSNSGQFQDCACSTVIWLQTCPKYKYVNLDVQIHWWISITSSGSLHLTLFKTQCCVETYQIICMHIIQKVKSAQTTIVICFTSVAKVIFRYCFMTTSKLIKGKLVESEVNWDGIY